MTRVKVEYEGELMGAQSRSTVGIRRDGDGRTVYVNPDYVTVIEPEYESGEVYQGPKGSKFLRLPGKQWRPVFIAGTRMTFPYVEVSDDYPERPLVKLVPES